MSKKLFDKTLPKKCAYCLHSNPLGNAGEMVCRKKGIIDENDYCKGYKYDPLKREPLRQLVSTDFTPDDIKL